MSKFAGESGITQYNNNNIITADSSRDIIVIKNPTSANPFTATLTPTVNQYNKSNIGSIWSLVEYTFDGVSLNGDNSPTEFLIWLQMDADALNIQTISNDKHDRAIPLHMHTQWSASKRVHGTFEDGQHLVRLQAPLTNVTLQTYPSTQTYSGYALTFKRIH